MPTLLNPFRFTLPPVLTYIGLTTHTADETVATYTNHAIGTAAADRFVVVAASGDGAVRTVDSVTIGGSAATNLVACASNRPTSALFGLTVAAGTTATIVVTYSGTVTSNYVSVYAVTGLLSTTPTSTNSTVETSGSTTISHAVTESQDGVLITAAASRLSAATGWTNAVEDNDVFIETDSVYSSASVGSGLGTASRTITATFTNSSTGRSLATVVLR